MQEETAHVGEEGVRQSPFLVRLLSDSAGTLTHRTDQLHKKIVATQAQMISIVPRPFGCGVHPCTVTLEWWVVDVFVSRSMGRVKHSVFRECRDKRRKMKGGAAVVRCWVMKARGNCKMAMYK